MKLEDLKIEDEQLLENVKKVVQGAEDRVRTEYSKKGKDKDDIINELKEKLEKYEPSKQKDEKDLKIDNLTQMVETLIADKNNSIIETKLKNANIPTSFSKYLKDIDIKNVDDEIKSLGEMFKSQLNDYIPNSGRTETKTYTKEEFNNMSFDEQVALAENNPSLYESFTK